MEKPESSMEESKKTPRYYAVYQEGIPGIAIVSFEGLVRLAFQKGSEMEELTPELSAEVLKIEERLRRRNIFTQQKRIIDYVERQIYKNDKYLESAKFFKDPIEKIFPEEYNFPKKTKRDFE